MTLLTRLLERFKTFGYRHAYVDSFTDSLIATQIKVLREQRHLSQTALAELAGMKQSQVSKLEDVNHTSWKVSTLKKLARAFDLVLVVRFESFGSVLPEIDRFGRALLERKSFDEDPIFAERSITQQPVGIAATIDQIQTGGTAHRVLAFKPKSDLKLAMTVGSTTTSANFVGNDAVAQAH